MPLHYRSFLFFPTQWLGQLQETGLPVCHNNCFCLSYLVQSKQAKFIARAARDFEQDFCEPLCEPSISLTPSTPHPTAPQLGPPQHHPPQYATGPLGRKNPLKVSLSFPITQLTAPSLHHRAVPWRQACTFRAAGSSVAPLGLGPRLAAALEPLLCGSV